MGRWFRFYDDAMHDAKLLRLSDATFRAWVTLLCVASRNGGVLPAAADIAVELRCKPALVASWIAELSAAGLIDKISDGFVPHNWNERQYKSDSSSERMKRHRDRKRDVTSDVTVTVQNRTETEADTEQKEETRVTALVPDGFDTFWFDWPNKVGKPAALKAYKSAINRGATLEEILIGAGGYIRSKPPDRPWLNPATFLNQERWKDRPAEVGTKNGTSNSQSGSLLASIKRELAELEAEAGTDPALPGGNLLRLSDGSVR